MLTYPSLQISWSTMPLPVLHQYRYVYNLPCPSAFSSPINALLLSNGIGLRSPTAIAARRAHASKHPATATAPPTKKSRDQPSPSNAQVPESRTGSMDKADREKERRHDSRQRVSKPGSGSSSALGRVSKDQLANAVRKHFNNAAISEQDAIARFLYKVHEEKRGREFRLRFQP